MANDCLPKCIFCGERIASTQLHVGQKKGFKSTLDTLKEFVIDRVHWKAFTQKSSARGNTVEHGLNNLKANESRMLKGKGKRRKQGCYISTAQQVQGL